MTFIPFFLNHDSDDTIHSNGGPTAGCVVSSNRPIGAGLGLLREAPEAGGFPFIFSTFAGMSGNPLLEFTRHGGKGFEGSETVCAIKPSLDRAVSVCLRQTIAFLKTITAMITKLHC